MRWISTLVPAILACLFVTDVALAACDMRAGKSVADAMNDELRHVVRSAKLACLATEDGGKCAITCTTATAHSDGEVMSMLSVITIFAAENMEKAGLQKFSRIRFADKNLLQRARLLSLRAELAAEVAPVMIRADRAPPGILPMLFEHLYEEVPGSTGQRPRR